MPYQFQIAGVVLELDTDISLDIPDAFQPFLVDSEKVDYRIVYRQVESLPPIPRVTLHEDVCYCVHPDGKGGYIRSFFDPPRDMTPYAVERCDYAGGYIQVDYLAKGAHCLSQIGNSFFHLGFEALLIHRDRLCLHAACVDTPWGGILFSGPSGIGKSTQADLWCRLRGAKQINGDRPLLSCEGGWRAWGSPYAGSSRCHVNDSCAVKAIVMLQQSPACSLRRLTQPEAFRAIWSGLTMHSWDSDFVAKASDLALQLMADVPVYELCCTPDERAVQILEDQLRKEGGQ